MPVLAIFSQFSLLHLLIVLFHLSTKCKKIPYSATSSRHNSPSSNCYSDSKHKSTEVDYKENSPHTCIANFSAGALVIPHHLMGYLLVSPGLCMCFTTLTLLYLHHQLHNNFLSSYRMSCFTTLSRDLPIV